MLLTLANYYELFMGECIMNQKIVISILLQWLMFSWRSKDPGFKLILEQSLPFMMNLIGEFQGTKSLSCPKLRSPQVSCHLLGRPLLICPHC